MSTFWATFGKIGLLFTPTSGHTTSGNSLTKCSLSASILKSIFYFSFLAPTMQCDQMLKYKVAQIFPIDAQKATIGAFTRNVLFYFSPKIYSKIGYFLKKICHQDLSKMPQYGHTATMKMDPSNPSPTLICPMGLDRSET